MSLPSSVDVAIIGAGAAGLGAAHALAGSGLSVAAQMTVDEPASMSREMGNRWDSMIDAISTYINGCELKDMSTRDWDAYEDSEINWRVRRGYGALIATYGAPCPVALNCNVTLIDHSGKRVRIET